MEESSPGHREVTVLTLNVYFGTDLGPAFGAQDLSELIETLGKLWAEVQATDIPGRAVSVAHQIAASAPDLVGLQEIALWSVGTPGAMAPKYDFLLLILEALQNEGLFYAPIAVNRDLNRFAPADMSGNFVEFHDRHAVLLRVGPNPSKVRPYDVQAKTFATLYEKGSPLLGALSVPRSWIAVDALLDARKFRFIETHLESLEEAVQVAQSNELISWLANADLPIIMVGDFNSNGNQDPRVEDHTSTYPDLLAAGFRDAWAALNAGDPGLTCCHAPDLRNIEAELNRRLDLILLRGAISPISVKLIAAEPAARTPSGVWPSDHAGLLAKLRLD